MDLMCLSLSVDMNDEEIKECIQEMIPVCTVQGRGFCLSINGYDNDPRELWEIPEALSFMKSLCRLGFISTLEVSTTCPELVRKEYKTNRLPGFGALEIWMCATDRMGPGKNDLDKKTMRLFENALNESNRIAEAVMKEPAYRTGIKKSGHRYQTTIPDAPIKHGYNKERGTRWKSKQ